jgi:hypothetical protein
VGIHPVQKLDERFDRGGALLDDGGGRAGGRFQLFEFQFHLVEQFAAAFG